MSQSPLFVPARAHRRHAGHLLATGGPSSAAIARALEERGFSIVTLHGGATVAEGQLPVEPVSGPAPWPPRAPVHLGLPTGCVADSATSAAAVRAVGRIRAAVAAIADGSTTAVLIEHRVAAVPPTLLVAATVSRRVRRRVLRSLPRGSRVVQATDVDAALAGVARFFDVAWSHRPGESRTGTRRVRRLSARVAPAGAVLAGTFAVAGPAQADAECGSSAGQGVLTIACKGHAATVGVRVDADGSILLDGARTGASVADTSLIHILGTDGADVVEVDESTGRLGKMDGDQVFEPTAIKVELGQAEDSLSWVASKDVDRFVLRDAGIDLPGGGEVDAQLRGVETLSFDLGAGDDTFDGGPWTGPLSIDGGEGADVVRGGVGNDVVAVSAGSDIVDGAAGHDRLELTADDALIRIDSSSIKLTDARSEIEHKDFQEISWQGGDAVSKVELTDLTAGKYVLDGGGGADSLKLTADDALIRIDSSSIKLTDARSEIEHKQFDEISWQGGDAVSKVELTDLTAGKYVLDGGGGADSLKLTADDALITLTDSSVRLERVLVEHEGLEELAYFGGAAANTVDGSALTSTRLTADGGAGDDTLIGGARADVLLGDLGSDVIHGNAGDDVVSGGAGDDRVSGDGGLDTLEEAGDVDFTATKDSLTGLGSDSLESIEALHLTGGVKDNTIDASKFRAGPVTLDGGAGDDVLIGGAHDDLLFGSEGDDHLIGRGGNDKIFAGDGDDRLDGSAGVDVGDGGPGDDSARSIEIATNI